MSKDQVNIEIGSDLIKPIIENKVKIAIIESLKGEQSVIEATVNAVLEHKVNENGEVDKYSSYNKYQFIDIVLRKAIEDACRDAVKEYITEKKEVIRKEVMRQLQTKKGTSAFVTSFINGMLKASESDYRFKAEFKFQELGD